MTVATKAAVILFNPLAGTAAHACKASEIGTLLGSVGLEASITVLQSNDSATELAREFVRQGHETIIACGGDGTVSAVASALAGTDAALGIIPAGTLNHFAKDLNIPMNVREAAEVIARRRTEVVDVADVNGRIFVNNSSIGIYPNIVIERERRRRGGLNKWFALGLATLQILRRHPFWSVRISVQGKTLALRTPFVFVGNNEYETRGLRIGRRHSLLEGLLYLYAATPVSRVGLVWMAVLALFGGLDKTRALRKFAVDEAWIETRRRHVRVSADGEVLHLQTPLHYRIRARALKVVVP